MTLLRLVCLRIRYFIGSISQKHHRLRKVYSYAEQPKTEILTSISTTGNTFFDCYNQCGIIQKVSRKQKFVSVLLYNIAKERGSYLYLISVAEDTLLSYTRISALKIICRECHFRQIGCFSAPIIKNCKYSAIY